MGSPSGWTSRDIATCPLRQPRNSIDRQLATTPIAEQIRGPSRDKTTTKQNKPTRLKKLKTRRARDCAGVCEAPRGLCEFRCRGMMHHDGSWLKLLTMPLGIGVAWAQRDGIRAPLVAFNVASAGLSRFGPPDTGDDNTNNDKT